MYKVTVFQDPSCQHDLFRDTDQEDCGEGLISPVTAENYVIPTVKAATVVGLQDPDEGIWVFNDEVHINAEGKSIPPSESPYIWLGKYYPSQQGHAGETSSVIKDNSLAAKIQLPLDDFAIADLIESL